MTQDEKERMKQAVLDDFDPRYWYGNRAIRAGIEAMAAAAFRKIEELEDLLQDAVDEQSNHYNMGYEAGVDSVERELL